MSRPLFETLQKNLIFRVDIDQYKYPVNGYLMFQGPQFPVLLKY